MNSLLTNSAALTVLQTISSNQSRLEDVQARISTGLRVRSAADDAAYWAIATTMQSDNSALSAVKDALGIGAATVDVVSSALQTVVSTLGDYKTRLIAARQPGIDRQKVQSDIEQFQSQLKSIADSAVFNRENWLAQDSSDPNYNATKSIVASFSRVNGAITLGTIDVNITALKLYDSSDQSGILDKSRTIGATTAVVATIDISTITDTPADLQKMNDYIQMVDDAMADVTSAAASVGSVRQRTNSQISFVATLMDSITRGVGQLVDADMSRESSRLQALQTQQQLGIQALSIANSNTQLILKLFGG